MSLERQNSDVLIINYQDQDNENNVIAKTKSKNFLQIPGLINQKNGFLSPSSTARSPIEHRKYDSNNSLDDFSPLNMLEQNFCGPQHSIKVDLNGSLMFKENHFPFERKMPEFIDEPNNNINENTIISRTKFDNSPKKKKVTNIHEINSKKFTEKFSRLSTKYNITGTLVKSYDLRKKMKIKALKKIIIPLHLQKIDAEYQEMKETPNEEKIKFIKMARMSQLEYVQKYNDSFPLLSLRKFIWKLMTLFSNACRKIIDLSAFENLTLLVIIWNTIMLALYDPLTDTSAYPSYFDDIFLIYYTIEMFLKIFGLGMIIAEDAYLKDPWNIMDFVIVITAYIPIFFGSGGVNLRGLRSLRVLRPLRTISTIKSLRVIVSTVLQTLPYMRDIIFIALFSFFVYAIVGLQLFMGVTKNRCIDLNTGIPIFNIDYPEINYQQYCGAWSCTSNLGLPGMNLGCAKMISEPFYGVTNFGTILWALLNVYQTVTQEGWSTTMFIIQLTWNPIAAIYFISCTFIGTYYFMNLIMAVITTIFEMNVKQDGEELKEKRRQTYEEMLMQLVNKHKQIIIKLISQYQKGETKYYKIQFINEKLYLYDAKNSQLKKSSLKILKTYWKKLLILIIGDRISKQPKKNHSPLNTLQNTGNSISIDPIKNLPRNKILPLDTESTDRNLLIKVTNSPLSSHRINKNGKIDTNISLFSPLKTKKTLIKRSETRNNNQNIIQNSHKLNHIDNSEIPTKELGIESPKQDGKNKVGSYPLGRNNSIKPKLEPISAITKNHTLINNPSTMTFPVSDNRMPSKTIRNIKINPLGIIMNKKKPCNSVFSDIKEVDENDNSVIFKLQESSQNLPVKNQNQFFFQKKRTKNSLTKKPEYNQSGERKDTEENASFLISSDEISTDEIQGAKGLDELDPVKQKKDSMLLKPSKIAHQKKNSKNSISNLGDRSKSKKSSRKDDESSIIGVRNRGPTIIQQKLMGLKELGTDYIEKTPKNTENIEDTILNEYSNDDKNTIKDRYVIDIRYLKIDVNFLDINTKLTSVDEVIPSYKDQNRVKKEEKEARKRSKIKLYPYYRLCETEKGGNIPKYNETIPIYDIPIRNNKTRILSLKNSLKKYNTIKEQTLFTEENTNTLDSERSNQKPLLNNAYQATSGSTNQNKRRNIISGSKSIRTFRKIGGQGEPDVELIYSAIKNKIDDDLNIDIKEILDMPAAEYFNIDKEYSALNQNDITDKSIKQRNWSAHQILFNYYMERINKIKNALMEKYISIWEPGYLGLIQSLRRRILLFCEGDLFSNFLLLVVLVNTIFLASPGLISEDNTTNTVISQINQVFTMIFIVEMGLKLIGMGPIEYVQDTMNLIDGSVVLISIVDLILEASAGAFKAFRAIRIFRATRVLRVTKLLRALAFMRFLIGVLSKTLKDFLSVLLLMGIFLYIYALLGMQLLGGQFDYPDNIGWSKIRNNFDTLPQSLISVYQIMTVENWNNILFFAERSDAGYYLPLVYLISWIVIGNYILLNLLMALLLAQFSSDDIDEEQEELEEADDKNKIDDEGDEIETKVTTIVPIFHFSMTNPKLTNINNNILQALTTTPHKNDSIKSTPSIFLLENEEEINKKQFIMYENNKCEKSICIFKKSWYIRSALYRLIKKEWFDYLLLMVILISSLKLAFDTYFDPTDPSVANITFISEYVDLSLNIFFLTEAIFKIVALGFIFDSGCYLRDSWNILDFIIVASGIIDLASTSINLPFLKILRLLRTLRPLRLVTHNKNMRLIVTALLSSVSGILNVFLVIMMIILIFAILGVNLLRGKLGVCNISSNPNLSIYGINYETCQWLGYEWIIWDINWENVFQGMLSLFVLTTQEGWPDYMFKCTDANDPDVGPIENNYLIIFCYFAVFLLVGAYFLVNLFVGVIMYEYSLAEKEEKKKYSYLTDEQEKWIELQKMILNAKPDVLLIPKNCFQKFWLFFVQLNLFEVIIMLCILANMFTMGLNYDESLPAYNQKLKTINYVFTGIFIFEMLAKMSAYGFKIYFMDNWNKFDFFVVSSSILDILFDNLEGASLAPLRVAPQIARVFRIMRVTRLIRLIKQFPSVQKLLSTLIFSLPSMANVFALVLLAFFIYSVLATFLFSNILTGQTIGLYVNFSNFTNSIITLFRCSTGENWYIILFDTIHPASCIGGGTDCGPNRVVCMIFWVSFIILIQYIVLNLFVMVILNLFSDFMMNENNPLHHFSENIESFKNIWNKFSKKNNGLHINQNQVMQFFINLPEPLGYKKEGTEVEDEDDVYNKKIASAIMKMNIRMNNNNNLSFHEVLFASFKKAYAPKEEGKKEGKELVKKMEEKTLGKIDILNKSLALKKAFVNPVIKQKKVLINPLFQLLFVGMSIKAWRNYLDKLNQYQAEHGNDTEYITSSSSLDSEEDNKNETEREEDGDDIECENLENQDVIKEYENMLTDDRNKVYENSINDLENRKNDVNMDQYENEKLIMRVASMENE